MDWKKYKFLFLTTETQNEQRTALQIVPQHHAIRKQTHNPGISFYVRIEKFDQ